MVLRKLPDSCITVGDLLINYANPGLLLVPFYPGVGTDLAIPDLVLSALQPGNSSTAASAPSVSIGALVPNTSRGEQLTRKSRRRCGS